VVAVGKLAELWQKVFALYPPLSFNQIEAGDHRPQACIHFLFSVKVVSLEKRGSKLELIKSVPVAYGVYGIPSLLKKTAELRKHPTLAPW